MKSLFLTLSLFFAVSAQAGIEVECETDEGLVTLSQEESGAYVLGVDYRQQRPQPLIDTASRVMLPVKTGGTTQEVFDFYDLDQCVQGRGAQVRTVLRVGFLKPGEKVVYADSFYCSCVVE